MAKEIKSDRTCYLNKVLHIPIDTESYELINEMTIDENRTIANVCRNILWAHLYDSDDDAETES